MHVTRSFSVPFFKAPIELTVRDQKVVAVALASLAFFSLQWGLSWTAAMGLSVVLSTVTYLSERFVRSEPGQSMDWFNVDYNMKEMNSLVGFLLLRPIVIQIACWALNLPFPTFAQKELSHLIITRPWRMIPIVAGVAPVAEEILFRGFLLERFEDGLTLIHRHVVSLSRDLRDEVANVSQAVIFGALHLRRKIKEGWKWPTMAILSLVGYVNGYFKKRDESLLTPIAIHAANNTSVLAYLFATQG